MANHLGERSLGELFSELSQGLSKMFRQEIDLAKTELKIKAKQGMRDAVFLIAGAILLFSGLLVLLAAAVAALALAVPLWLSALIIGVVVCGAAYTLIQKGISDLKKRKMAPEHTVESIKESGKWIKQQI